MPNVGKSLLFNALVGRELAVSANYPFTTIKSNTGSPTIPFIGGLCGFLMQKFDCLSCMKQKSVFQICNY